MGVGLEHASRVGYVLVGEGGGGEPVDEVAEGIEEQHSLLQAQGV